MGRYAFIPFPDKEPMVRRVERKNASHDRKLAGMWFGALEVELVCEQPVHIGSGFKAAEEGKVVRRTARSGSSLLIPGSTFKGVIRSRFEAITRSCAGDLPSDRARVVSRSHPEVQRGHFTNDVRKMPAFDGCGRGGLLCPACALFGYQTGNESLRGRVSVADLLSAEGVAPTIASMPSQFEPRIHHLGEFRIEHNGREPEFEVGPLYGRKFYLGPSPTTDALGYEHVEAIPTGTRLRGTIRIFNLNDVEMGGLLAALGIRPQSRIKLGNGKRHGFGRVLAAVVPVLSDERRAPRGSAQDAWASAFEESPDAWEPGARKLLALHQGAC